MPKQRVTIKDISGELGVSCAIITRALNDRPGVSDALRRRITETARRLGYQPNSVARSMARSPIRIGIVIPCQWQSFYSSLEKGIAAELDSLLDYKVTGEFYRVENPYSADDYISKLEACANDGVDGILLADIYPVGLDDLFGRISEKKTPIVTIGLPGKNTESVLSSVSVDSYCSGVMAAQMLSKSVDAGGRVVIFVGSRENEEHSLKISGFTAEAKRQGLRPEGAYETNDDAAVAERIFENLSQSGKAPDGIYLATSGAQTLPELIFRMGVGTRIVTTDVSDELVSAFRHKNMVCSIFQDPEKQGRLAVRALYESLAEHIEPERKILIPPSIVIEANLAQFIEK